MIDRDTDGWVKLASVGHLCPDCLYDFTGDEIWWKPCPWHKSAIDLRG